MKKIFLIGSMLFSFSFCLTERATGYQLKESGTAFWFSFINNSESIGAAIQGDIGVDFAVSEKVELCFDLGRELGTKFSENSQTLQFRWWIGSDLSISWGKDFGNNTPYSDSDFLGVKFLKGNSWLAFTRNNKDTDNSTWSLGKLWNRTGKMNIGVSYHFSSDDIDKGDLRFAFGKAI